LANQRFRPLRDLLLRSHNWVFAIERVELGAPATSEFSERHGFNYAFTRPANVGRIISVTDADSEPLEYFLRGDSIYTNSDSAYLEYVKSGLAFDDNSLYPDDFSEALAYLLAADICIALTQNGTLRDTMLRDHAETLRTARFNGSCEIAMGSEPVASWIYARSGASADGDPRLRGFDGIPPEGL